MSFIAALFKSSKEDSTEMTSGKEGERNSTQDSTQKDPNKQDDFLFALFIAQEADPQLLSNEAGSTGTVVWKSNHPLLISNMDLKWTISVSVVTYVILF